MITEVMEDELYFAKTKPNAIIPTKRDEDAGYDIYTCETDTIVIEPCSTRLIDSGIAMACNKAYFPKFFDKGGMGSKGIIIGAGVGDSGYRDSYFIPLINTNKDKTLIITTQNIKDLEDDTKYNYFDLDKKEFIYLDKKELTPKSKLTDWIERFAKMFKFAPFNILTTEDGKKIIKKENCIIKPINKAITQFVMLPVPKFKTKEITWDELKSISSERGIGKCGSSGK